MKIKTITCHNVYNHGASLQAYALSKYLQAKGHDVEIIDYRPDYLSNHYNLLHVSNPKYKNVVLKILYLLAKLPSRLFSLRRKWAFDKFTDKHLKLTKETYKDFESLNTFPPEAELYICGSDQIWNTLHKNGKDPAFYLDFGNDSSKKISFAASLATETIYGGMEGFIADKLSKFYTISCRETSGIKLLNSIGVGHVSHVLDPAFLLDKEEWNQLAYETYDENFILVYDFENSTEIKNLALEEAKKRNCKIYSINPGKYDYVDQRFDNVGPATFLSLVRDSQLVISNSFHAVVFPLIYKKDFAIVKREENINSRMQDIYKTIGKSESYNKGSVIRYSEEIDRLLKYKIFESKDFLNNAIE